jgi:hypothetical protein
VVGDTVVVGPMVVVGATVVVVAIVEGGVCGTVEVGSAEGVVVISPPPVSAPHPATAT